MVPLLLTALVLGDVEPYVRTRTSMEEGAHCLWWGAPTVTFQQSVVGNPTTGQRAFSAVTTAFATWQVAMAQCGSLTLQEGPRLASRKVGVDPKGNNANLVLFRMNACSKRVPANHSCWADQSCGNTFDCWDHASGLLGVTVVSYDADTGEVFDADVELNAASNVFTTVDSPVCAGTMNQSCVAVDLQNTVTHEAGHFLGLDHANTAQSTMSARAPQGEITKRVLDMGTRSFACEAYPKGLGALDCVVSPLPASIGTAPAQGCGVTLAGPLLALALLLGRRTRGALVALLVWSGAASAATVVAMDEASLRASASLVVRAKVSSSVSRWSGDGARIVTESTLDVLEVLAGVAPKDVVVTQPGGVVGKVGQRVAGVVPLVPGVEVVLFLESAGPGFRVVGLSQGLFFVERAIAVQAASDVETVAPVTGVPVEARRLRLPLAALRSSFRSASHESTRTP